MSICYIVGAGDFEGGFFPSEDDLVIAADGGYDNLCRSGIRCDLLIGDLDSIREVPEGVRILRHPVRKDETDMHLCYLEGASRTYREFMIYGGTGGREDHTFANYSLLLYAKERGDNATLVGTKSVTRVVKNEKITLCGEKGKHLSVFAFSREARGVSIKGAEYEAEGITLTPSFPLGASNLFCEGEVTVSVEDGILLVMSEK